MEPSILFNGSPDHDDTAYLTWLDANPEGFVANIPHPHTPYDHFLPVILHQASCPDARNPGNGGKLTSNTQWKACDLSLDLVKRGALRYTQGALKYYQSNRNGGCGSFGSYTLLVKPTNLETGEIPAVSQKGC